MDDTQNLAEVAKTTGLKLFDGAKSKIFWVVVGFALCKYLDRKK